MVPQVRNPLNPFFPRVMDGAEQAAYEHGYSLVLAFGRRGAYFDAAASVDGILACSQPLPQLGDALPAVLLDYTVPRRVPSVRHLAELGHTRIGHVRSRFPTPTFQARARAFRRATAGLDTAEVTADLQAARHHALSRPDHRGPARGAPGTGRHDHAGRPAPGRRP